MFVVLYFYEISKPEHHQKLSFGLSQTKDGLAITVQQKQLPERFLKIPVYKRFLTKKACIVVRVDPNKLRVGG